MINSEKTNKASSLILQLAKNDDDISIANILESLKGRGLALLMAVFAVPVAMPMPAPILATILGLPVLLFAVQIMLGKKNAWLPEKVKSKNISSKVLKLAANWLKKIELLLHPRLGFIIITPIIGFFCVIFSLVMMLPFPLTNTVPGFAVLVISLGLFERDGLFVLGGIIIGSLWIALLSYATIVAGSEFVEFIRNMLA